MSDASKLSVKHAHLIKNTGTEESSVWTEDTAVEDIAFASVVSAGKCGLTIESSQYSSDDTAGLSYWGHRATYDYAEIIQADTQTSIAFTHADGTEIAAGETVDKADRLTYTGYGHAPPRQHGNGQRARRRSHHLRRPHQHYIALADDRDPKLLGEALTLPASETADTDGYAYSTATLTTDLSAYSKASGSGPTIGPTATLWNPS